MSVGLVMCCCLIGCNNESTSEINESSTIIRTQEKELGIQESKQEETTADITDVSSSKKEESNTEDSKGKTNY